MRKKYIKLALFQHFAQSIAKVKFNDFLQKQLFTVLVYKG